MTQDDQKERAPTHLGLLDAASQSSLDRLLSLVRQVLEVSQAAVILESPPERGFPSATGWTIQEPKPEMSFCAETTPDTSLLVVEDTSEDSRLSDRASDDRFCAGAPLMTEDDHRLGTLYLGHEAPRVFGSQARVTLWTLAGIVVNLLEMKTMNAEIGYLKSALRQADDSVLITEAHPIDPPGPRIVWANEAFSRMTGYDRTEIVGESPRVLQGPETERSVLNKVRSALENERSVHAETVNYHKDGTPYVVSWHISPVYDDNDDLTHWVSIQRDVTDEQRRQERLKHEAKHDALTGLPNRYAVHEEIRRLVGTGSNHRNLAALLYIDLDEFKPINDTFGHQVGDQVLIRTADVLQSELRRQDIIGRIGGDEFVVCLPNVDRFEEARTIAERLYDALQHPFEVAPNKIQINASVGGVVGLTTFETMEDALHTADMAMYRAKDAPGKKVVLRKEPAQTSEPSSNSLPA